MVEVQSPHPIPQTGNINIFLGGSIEMGHASEWQREVVQAFADVDVVLLNPRRDDWDSSLRQSKDEPEFRVQVEWELHALSESDFIIFYLDPNTKSPITLLEIGLYAQSGKLLVVCPEGFWRKGNVDIVCEKYGILQFATLDALLCHLKSLLVKK